MRKALKVAILMGFALSMTSVFTGCTDDSEVITSDSMYFENVMPYQAQNLSDYISVSGTVQSESAMNVTSSVSAKVTQLNVSVGDYVNVGDVLCVLDNTDIQRQITDLEKSIENASALDENTKELNRKALQNAKYDQTIQLKSAKEAITEAKSAYNKVYQKYSDTIKEINTLVQQYNDISQQIADYENSMQNSIYDDSEDYNYDDDTIENDESYIDDSEFLDVAEDMSYNPTMSSYQYKNLSYDSTSNDEYSSLVAKRDEISSKIETYKSECESYEEQFDSLKKAITEANDNYDAVKRSTDQAIETAQNTVDMQDYQDGDSSTSTQLEDLKKQLEGCTIKAEKSGTITSLAIAQGDTPTQGALLMTIENNSQLKITVNIEEKDILKVEEGMNVVITSEATGETEIKGTVSKVIKIISSDGNSQSLDGSSSSSSSGFTAEITIDEDSDLLVGMKAKAKIMLVEKTGCYSVLYDSIMYDDDGTPYVLVADPNSDTDSLTATVKRVDVTVGDESGSYVEVTSDGLKENDLIITTPYEVTEGDTLQLDPSALDFGTDEDTSEILETEDSDIEVID
jgi:multidrug efflux pump subunit AcrA (membrane-fusion protein)